MITTQPFVDTNIHVRARKDNSFAVVWQGTQTFGTKRNVYMRFYGPTGFLGNESVADDSESTDFVAPMGVQPDENENFHIVWGWSSHGKYFARDFSRAGLAVGSAKQIAFGLNINSHGIWGGVMQMNCFMPTIPRL